MTKPKKGSYVYVDLTLLPDALKGPLKVKGIYRTGRGKDDWGYEVESENNGGANYHNGWILPIEVAESKLFKALRD